LIIFVLSVRKAAPMCVCQFRIGRFLLLSIICVVVKVGIKNINAGSLGSYRAEVFGIYVATMELPLSLRTLGRPIVCRRKIFTSRQRASVSFRHSPGGAKPPPGEAMGPPGKVEQKIFMQVLPDKAPRGDALGPPGKIFSGGPTLGAPFTLL
jgi:hypothetical protein